MITSRDVSAGRRKRSLCSMNTRARACSPCRLGEVSRGGAQAALAVEFVVDERHREVRFLADGLLARGDRIQARRQRPQGLHESLRFPVAGVPLQHVDELQVLERAAQRRFVSRLQHLGQARVAGALGLLRQERTRQARELATVVSQSRSGFVAPSTSTDCPPSSRNACSTSSTTAGGFSCQTPRASPGW